MVESGDRVERAHLFAPGASPELERGRIRGVEVLPEALAGTERVDDDVGRAGDALEELEEAAGDMREAEDVKRARKRAASGRERGHRFVQGHDRRSAGTRCRETPVAEHREPQAALPPFDLGMTVAERRGPAGRRGSRPAPSLAPRGEHVPARVRVLLEEPADARRELDASHVHRVGGLAAAAQVRANRRELRVGERLVVEQEAKRHGLDRGRIREARAGACRARPRPRAP